MIVAEEEPMDDTATVDTAAVIAEVNVALGTDYQLVRRLAGGLQSGAFELSDGNTRVVLKWSADPSWAPRVHRAARLVAKARAAGYPTPAWLAVGTTSNGSPYQLQEFVEGTPLRDASTIDRGLAERLVEICELQRDLVDDREFSWSGYVRRIVFEGWDNDTWETVRRYDETSAELIAGYERVCRPYRDEELPADDLVHGDLNVSNLIVADGQLAAVIDIESASGGTRAYDLISLAASAARDNASPGVDEYFLQAALRAAGRPAAAVCAASAYATMAVFIHDKFPTFLPLIHEGGTRLLNLLETS
jgi:aminoglycoside phosphotransferase (APT) family kinase protein